MNTAKLIKHHPTITCQSDLVEICKPLQKLNIVYFAHVHIDEQSNISGISLCPDFFKIYINHGFHQYDLHMSNLFGKRSHIVWKTVGIKKQSKEMHNYFTRFDRDHTFSIIKTSSTTKNYYHFAARIKHDFMNNKYLELLEELHCFINYFTDQVQLNKKLRTAYDIKIPINNNFGGFFF